MEQELEPFKFSETVSGTGNREIASGTENSGTASGTGNSGTASGTGNSGTASGTGNNGTASGTGNSGTASGTGNSGTASGTGNSGTASGTGNSGTASGTGNSGTASGTGNSGTASGTGNNGTASGTGNSGTASGTGNSGTASGTGNSGTASGTGNSGTASGTGNNGTASGTGNSGTASGTGNNGTASGTGNSGTALVTGNNGTARPSEPHLFPTNVSCDIVASKHLDKPHICLTGDLLTEKLADYLETQSEMYLDQNIGHLQNEVIKQSSENDVQQNNEKSATQVDDKSLLHIIDSADPHQAVQLQKGNNHFSQDGLDRALISACRHGLRYLVQTLVRLGANVQFRDTQGNTPLLICAGNGFIDIVHFLLEEIADVNAFNSAGDTALILSIRAAGSLEMVRVLLEQEGIDISHQNQDGYTALMKAVEVGDVDVMKILMEKYNKEETDGASGQVSTPSWLKPIDAVNLKGMTAEQIAENCGLRDIFHILKTHLINGVSPLLLAVERNDKTSLQILLDCQFVEKQDKQNALKKMLEKCTLKGVKTFAENDVSIIKMLLIYGGWVDPNWDGDCSLLSVAVKMGDYYLVELLCQQLDQQQQMTCERSSQALITAAELGRCDLIILLLEYNVDINHNNTYSGSALDCALRHGHLESAKLLIHLGATMDIKSALDTAVTNHLPDNVKFLFEYYKPEVMSYVTQDGRNLLNRLLGPAVQGGNLEIIGHLLDAGADVNYGNILTVPALGHSKNGGVAQFLISRGADVNILLHYVHEWLLEPHRDQYIKSISCKEVLKVLLENGVSVNERITRGRTLLKAAAGRTLLKAAGGRINSQVVELQPLLDHGADINAQNDVDDTALMEAVRADNHRNAEVLIRFLQAKKLSLNVQNQEGLTALTLAAIYNCPVILKKLINCSADVNVCDVKGNNALLHAVRNGTRLKGEVLTTLIRSGSDVNCQNNEGFSPLMLASKNGWIPIILMLLDSGADVNAVSKMDSTKTALSFLSAYLYSGRDLGRCLQSFLKKGARFSDINPSCLHIMIRNSDVDFIPELIQGGLAPVDVETKSLNLGIGDWEAIPALSPLCVALLVGNVSLARYFVGKLFMTSSDITSLTENNIIYRVLETRQSQSCLTFLDELSSQPWSLFQLAFVSVSSAVGSSPERENRVKSLQLPQVIQDKLLFK